MKELVPQVDTWDQVAETYKIEIEEQEYQIAEEVAGLLEDMGILPGASLIELGCGSGHLSACLAMKGYRTALFDFSKVALEKAKETYEKYQLQGEFICGDLMKENKIEKTYDVAWNSGVMEHFGDAELWQAFSNAAKYSSKGSLFIVPNPESVSYNLMRARLMSDRKWEYGIEYLRKDYEEILKRVGFSDIRKTYLLTSEMSAHHMWVASQYTGDLNSLYKLLMEQHFLPEKEGYLMAYSCFKGNVPVLEEEELYRGDTEVKTKLFDLSTENFGLASANVRQEEQLVQLTAERTALREELEAVKRELEQEALRVSGLQETLTEEIAQKIRLQEELTQTVSKVEGLETELEQEAEKLAGLRQENECLQQESERIQHENECVKQENSRLEHLVEERSQFDEIKSQMKTYESEIERLKASLKEKDGILAEKADALEEREQELLKKDAVLEARNRIIQEARQRCLDMVESKLFKLTHFLYRTKYQGMKGDKEEQKKYRRWITSKATGGGGDADRRYNPLYAVIEILQKNDTEAASGTAAAYNAAETQLGKHLRSEQARLSKSGADSKETAEVKRMISERKYKGILIYPHVVYWEPLQTPQQLLRSFAKCGWLCFFCEHPNIKDAFREVEPGVVVTHEKELLEALGETEVVVLLTWLGSLSFVDRIKNKKIWYHILDKLDLFPYYDDYYLSLHEQYERTAECVSYVASPLTKCLQQRSDAIYLPNAVNPEEFLNIHDSFVPDDMKPIVETGHKIIGYYGYLAEWMDYDMVRRAALARPEYEFVFIGKAIHDTSKFDDVPNIHLLGLKPYKELSDYAKFFDIATIPFVINEKMDCVSPIKFYEYCALGIPVITSRMKEMERFVCEFVACVDGYDEYLFYLDKFVKPDIRKMAKEKAPLIAAENTWLSRAKVMEGAFDSDLDFILEQKYDKFDVIILAVIDYDFRFQRPQHFAVRFAENGHRVFYVNANHFNPASVTKIQENLFVVNIHNEKYSAIHLTDWEKQQSELKEQLDGVLNQYCIRDAITIVDYPNWIYGAEYLRKAYGFKMITDYMDDYTGFLNPAEKLVQKNCEKLLKSSDQVIASSQFLYDIASKYHDNMDIIRNGTEYDHFHKAEGSVFHERKVIGYYGAIAEWFDRKKVIHIAESMPECDVVLIGHVTEGRKELSQYPNIKLLGEKPYGELPKYLKEFDVCLIPFDTSTDLIKATNPVKFYEYLSAGKKIVATEIPELEPYRDQYVYMANDDDKFLEYVRLCLEGNDQLRPEAACMEFASENDWQHRYEAFAEICRKSVPKISVVVLTYNNLDINKLCITSILEKTAYPNYELIVVDNMSTDGTREYLEAIDGTDDKLKIILNHENKGFAGGNNVGIKASQGEYVLLLNNDTVVTRGWLTAMSKHLCNDEKLGMCGPVTNSIGNEAKIKVPYHNMKEFRRFAYQYTTEHLNQEYKDVKVLALFCTMIKREVIDQCGLLDETYGRGMFEDDDYSEAVRDKGYTITIAEDAFIHHFEGVSFKKLESEEFRRLYDENKQKFEKKWNKKWVMHKKRPGIEWNTNADVTIL